MPQRYFRLTTLIVALALVVGASSSVTAHDPSHAHHQVDDHAAPQPPADHDAEAPFLAENDAAMVKMMRDMAAKPTGDVDRDFVEMMIPHHQGAIDMAVAVLRHGRNVQLKRLAQEIIVTQQQEIAAMRLAVGDPLPPSRAAPTMAASPPPTFDQH
jgi:hypothetical protein